MNQSLVYGKDAVKIGFADYTDRIFVDTPVKTAAQQEDYVKSLANKCRSWYEPVFADQSKYLKVDNPTTPATEKNVEVVKIDLKEEPVKTTDVKALTQPPQQTTIKSQEDVLLNAVLLGLGVFVFLKIVD